jgi:opine dehydrogenase
MRVAVLGAGAIGFGGAAFLSERGHDPVLWSPSGRRTVELAVGKPLIATGALEGTFTPRVAGSCEEALADAQAIFVALPANGHRAVFDAAAPHIRPDQTVIISGHLSFGALYLSRKLAERGISAPIAAWGTTVTTGRQRSLTEVNLGLRAKVDVATVPAKAAEDGLAVCRELFGDRFVPRADLLAIAVSNLNPQNHMGIALLNLTRMEKGEDWGQNANLTEALARLLDALDGERLAIARAIGVQVRTILEHYHLSFGVPMGTMDEMSRFIRQRGDGVSGPKSLDTRYVLEDVPFGLVPTERLGRLVGAPAILHESGINLLCAIYGRDFRAENDLLPALGIDRLTLDDLRALCLDGYGSQGFETPT